MEFYIFSLYGDPSLSNLGVSIFRDSNRSLYFRDEIEVEWSGFILHFSDIETIGDHLIATYQKRKGSKTKFQTQMNGLKQVQSIHILNPTPDTTVS